MCLEHCNAAVSVEEGKSVTSPNQGSSSTNDRKWIYTVYRTLKIGVVSDQSHCEDLKTELARLQTMAFQQDTSKQGYSPKPSSHRHISRRESQNSQCCTLNLVWIPDPSWTGKEEKRSEVCLERWNAAVGVEEGKSITSANQRSSSTNDRRWIWYPVEHWKLE